MTEPTIIAEIFDTSITEVVVPGNDDVIVVEVYTGIPGPPGSGGSGGGSAGYVHIQNSPSMMWVIQHNLGIFPGGIRFRTNTVDTALTAADATTSYENTDALITHVNPYVTIANFLEPTLGTAYVS